MTLHLSEDILKQAGLTEQDVVIELACHLFDAERLPLWPAAQLCGMDRVAFEEELRKRKIAIYRPTVEDVLEDLRTLNDFRSRTKGLPE